MCYNIHHSNNIHIMEFNLSKTQKIIGLVVIISFLLCGVFTMVVDDEDESIDDSTETEEISKKDSVPATRPSITITEPSSEDPYKELESLIGLAPVKEEVKSLSNFIKVQQARKNKGLQEAQVSYHLVFTGNPGTGKTSVARIMARIYKDLGVLKKGHLVETDRSGLIAEYVGQTATKTNAVIDSALNGVLFIDEAYALTNGGEQDFGGEAIATLLKRMEDDRDSLVVIVAGYTDEMKQFIESNPGLQSRFNRYIEFPDYSAQELHDIYVQRAKKGGYQLTEEADQYLLEHLKKAVANKDRNFGNARYARNLYEKSITCQANRLAQDSLETLSKDALSIIEKCDIENIK